MKILIAPDSFKGAVTANEAADAIEHGILRVVPEAECVKVPMADGGEGTVRSLVDATGGRFIHAKVTGPLGAPVDATYGLLGNGHTAAIEMSAASGMRFVDGTTNDPLISTTYGTGELMRRALDLGVDELIIGLGGSATNDGGAGMAQALGVRLLDESGDTLPWGGGALMSLAAVDTAGIDPRLARTTVTLACDVTNPLTGPNGASAVFGPQKGATAEMVDRLDEALSHYADIIRQQLHRDVAHIPGAGAAGGLGAGLLAFTNSSMQPGVETVARIVGLREKAVGADLCFTGEGGIDAQTAYGKAPMGTARAVKAASPHCKVIALAGNVGEGVERLHDVGIDAVFGITPRPMELADAIAATTVSLSQVCENVMRLLA